MRRSPRSPAFATWLALASVAATCVWVVTAQARPTIRSSFFSAYPNAVGSRLDNLPSHATHCGVCHYDFNGGGTRNPYGVRLGQVIGSFPNTDAGRQQAIHSIENELSDDDAFSNLTEITSTAYLNTPTFPGLTPTNVNSCVNVPNLSEIQNYLVPTTGVDVTPPSVTVTAPNGGESWVGGSLHSVTWTATDNVGVVSVDVFYRDAAGQPWTPIGKGLANGGTLPWFVHNTPSTTAKALVVAYDAVGNAGQDSSNAVLTITATPGGVVPTTLRDFSQPGTHPFEGGAFQDHAACANCHGGYDIAVEPGHNFLGSMMGQAARDPLFFACLAVAEQDAPSSGDMCLRCHTPFGWMSGRSQPTSGSQLLALDRDGVACDFCHRAVDPIYTAGTDPVEDQAILNALLPSHRPTTYANGQYVIDPVANRRGPFTNPVAPHPTLTSPFHRTSELCGTCHDVSNPAFTRVAGADYAPGPLDMPADSISSLTLMPLERTYSEWKNSAFNVGSGVYAPAFAGNKPDGYVKICQDCHMRDVLGKGCNDPAAPLRPDLPLHDLQGGNAWMPLVVAAQYPLETDAAALSDGAARAVGLLQKAAELDVDVLPIGDSLRAIVQVTNHAGHKLPTGYPEGRRMWLQVTARGDLGQVVYQSGAYDPATGVLTHDPDIALYEAELGLSPALGTAIGIAHGPTFHFALNDTVYKDNRIPPQGFTNAAFAGFGGAPVDPDRPGLVPRYADGQNFDTLSYALPPTTRSLAVKLFYQTTSKEYVEFLRDANTTNAAGTTIYNLWTGAGRSAPVVMATDSMVVAPLGVGEVVAARLALAPRLNPFRGALELALTLPRPSPVRLEVFDARGRAVMRRDTGPLAAGTHRVAWDGRDQGGRDAGSGMFWIRATTGREAVIAKVVRLR